MRHFKYISLILFVFSACSFADTSSCGIPVDPNGNTFPIPTGNIPYFKMPNALCADKGEYTWDYSGTLADSNQLFSFQASIAQFARSNDVGIGFHIFNFAFKADGQWFYSNSTYGGESQKTQSVAQSLDWVSSSATLQHFSVSAASLLDSAAEWHFVSAGRVPQPPLFEGWVGQPGHEYQLTGVGSTFLWRYDAKTGAATVAPYTYSFSVTVLDQQGATMEGMGGGYVGPQLVPNTVLAGKAYNVESEVAQPRLKVLNFTVSFQAVGALKQGFSSQYAFSGTKGMLWNDFGPVDRVNSSSVTPNQSLSTLIQSAIPSGASQKLNLTTQQLQNLGTGYSASLYNGNWIPVEFTQGKYAGASLAFSVFWNKTEKYPSDQSTSDMSWSTFGWCDFFAGIIPHEVDSGASLLETLYPENPALPSVGTVEKPPYQVVLNKFVPNKFALGFPWAQKVTITIKANTPLRYALAAYADNLAKSRTADDPTQDVVITVDAISPVAQNTLFSNTLTQYYEGAAVPTIDGQRVGYSWIEHMV